MKLLLLLYLNGLLKSHVSLENPDQVDVGWGEKLLDFQRFPEERLGQCVVSSLQMSVSHKIPHLCTCVTHSQC